VHELTEERVLERTVHDETGEPDRPCVLDVVVDLVEVTRRGGPRHELPRRAVLHQRGDLVAGRDVLDVHLAVLRIDVGDGHQ
jgi:hypothetical protein